jgi:hypothetical protein
MQYPELFATAYTKNDKAPTEADGRVHVWNMHMQERPEFTFTCQVRMHTPDCLLSKLVYIASEPSIGDEAARIACVDCYVQRFQNGEKSN